MGEEVGANKEVEQRSGVGQEQIHHLLFGEQLSWQAIIYDLINSEQLDPWNIDLALLTNKYLEKLRELEEANLFVSSKVLYAASLLLRIKSEVLLNQYLPSLDDILFGREEKKKYTQERIELEEEVPALIQRTPLPRNRKVTLQELMSALGKAVRTENRRIERVVTARQQEIETAISIPKKSVNLSDQIKKIYVQIKNLFVNRDERMAFSQFSDEHNGGDRVGTFVPLLHLDNQHKVLLEQEGHLDEIWIWLKQLHDTRFAEDLERMRKEAAIEVKKDQLEREQEENDREEREQEAFESNTSRA